MTDVTQKEDRERNITVEKNKKTLGAGGVVILALQSIILYFSFKSFIDFAYAGSSGKSITLLLMFFLIAILEFFIVRFLITKKGIFSAFLFVMGMIASLFIVSILSRDSQLFVHDYKQEVKEASQSNATYPVYEKAVKELEQPQTIVDVVPIPGTYSYYLLTDNNSRLTSETLNGIALSDLKTLIGKKVEVRIDRFVSAAYPVYKYMDQWYYSVTIYYNTKQIDKIFFNVR